MRCACKRAYLNSLVRVCAARERACVRACARRDGKKHPACARTHAHTHARTPAVWQGPPGTIARAGLPVAGQFIQRQTGIVIKIAAAVGPEVSYNSCPTLRSAVSHQARGRQRARRYKADNGAKAESVRLWRERGTGTAVGELPEALAGEEAAVQAQLLERRNLRDRAHDRLVPDHAVGHDKAAEGAQPCVVRRRDDGLDGFKGQLFFG